MWAGNGYVHKKTEKVSWHSNLLHFFPNSEMQSTLERWIRQNWKGFGFEHRTECIFRWPSVCKWIERSSTKLFGHVILKEKLQVHLI